MNEAKGQGITLTQESVAWLEADTSNITGRRVWEIIKQIDFEVTFKVPANTVAPYRETIIIPFYNSTTNDNWKDDDTNDAEYYGWFDSGQEGRPSRTSSLISGCIQLKSAAANTGGANGTIRATQGTIKRSDLTSVAPPTLPDLPAGGHYQLLTVNSPDGDSFDFTSANPTGHGLFAASMLDRVLNPLDPEGNLILDPAATLTAIYGDDSAFAGVYNGSNDKLVARDGAGLAHLLSGFSYSALPSSLLSIGENQTVSIDADDIEEGDDALWLFYATDEGTVSYVLTATASTLPKLTISDATVTEGNSGTTNATFTVTLSQASSSTVVVDYTTTSGTATAGTDFTGVSGTLTFQPNETSKTITVPVTGETLYELGEDFFINLGSATNASVADGTGHGRITNDDTARTLTVSAPTGSVTYDSVTNTAIIYFTVTLSAASGAATSVYFATGASGDTATTGSDYDAASGTLTFAPGETTKTIAITIYRPTEFEDAETLSLLLSDPFDSTIGNGEAQFRYSHDLELLPMDP